MDTNEKREFKGMGTAGNKNLVENTRASLGCACLQTAFTLWVLSERVVWIDKRVILDPSWALETCGNEETRLKERDVKFEGEVCVPKLTDAII